MLYVGSNILAKMNNDRGAACMLNQDFFNALLYLDVAIEQDPNDVAAHWNRSLCLLNLGRYLEGFAEFEWRWGWYDWKWQLKKPDRIPRLPRWYPGDVNGKRILLSHDGGRGDGIMMLRYIPRLLAMDIDLTLLVMPEISRLAQQFDVKVVTEVPEVEELLLFNGGIYPMFSLPYLLSDTVETIPHNPYLKAKARPSGRRVGVCWSGVAQDMFSLSQFLELLQLKPEEVQALRPGSVVDGVQPFPEGGDFQDVADLMMGLDHVVSVDTAAINLAGALGHPSSHVVLPRVMDFRWYRAAAWYPSLRCYRQMKKDDWSVPFAQVREAIKC